MKLQLNENTLNAYINEAIKRELNEAGWDKLVKFGTKAGDVLKGAAKGTKNYVKALGGNKKLVGGLADEMDKILKNPNYQNLFKEFGVDSIDQLPKEVRKNPKKLLQFVKDMQAKNTKVHGDWKVKNGMVFNKELGAQGDALVRLERDLTKAINGTKLARVGTGLSAAGFGAGYLAGRSRKNGQNPDAPWNDGVADPGMNGDAQDETGGNDGGFDGTFPWDNTTPNWTPRRPKTPTPAAEGTPAEPERPKAPEWAYQPVSTINGQTGVTGTGETQQGLKQHPESYVDSAKRVMLQTASAGLAGNTGNPKLDNWKQTNRNTRRTANDAIDTMRRDGAITRNQARQDKRALKDTEKMIRRNAKDMQNNY